jgi:hypothetical protein
VTNDEVLGSALLNGTLDVGAGESLGNPFEIFLAPAHAVFDHRVKKTRLFDGDMSGDLGDIDDAQ